MNYAFYFILKQSSSTQIKSNPDVNEDSHISNPNNETVKSMNK